MFDSKNSPYMQSKILGLDIFVSEGRKPITVENLETDIEILIPERKGALASDTYTISSEQTDLKTHRLVIPHKDYYNYPVLIKVSLHEWLQKIYTTSHPMQRDLAQPGLSQDQGQ